MQLSRRSFLQGTIACSAVSAFGGCCSMCCAKRGRPAVQLYSIREYINGNAKTGLKGVGMRQALKDVAKLGYAAVEFAGYADCSNDAAKLKGYLDEAGLKACGTHVSRQAFEPNEITKTIEFNLAYGNNHLICPGGGMWPSKDWKDGYDAWWKKMTDFYAKAAETANKYGCTLGYHNHTNEFTKRTAMKDGTLMWDYFFSNTPDNVCMEQDVGWTVCAGQDPCKWMKKFPHRSPTLHAKENCGVFDANENVKWAPEFEGILGQPGKFKDGTSVVGVDWDALAVAADADGVKWWVVECERNATNLKAIDESLKFLKSKGHS